MHWLDRIATVVIRRPRLYPRLFPGGWGDKDRLSMLLDRVRTFRDGYQLIEPVFEGEREYGHALGLFVSPSEVLPERCRRGRVLHVEPSIHRQVVLMAATNDHSWVTRLRVAERLVDLGIGSVIVEHAFYGTRRAHDGPQPVHTVVEFIEMGIAAAVEGIGLTMWLANSGAVAGVAGFSMGGSNVAVVGALSPGPIAIAALAASHSSSPVFTEGILADSIDWDALGGRDSALPLLRDLLSNLSTLHLLVPPHTATAVFGIARGDGYVPEQYIRPTIDLWTGAEAVYVDPGHAAFHIWGQQVQADLIARAFARFERAYP